MTTAITTLTRRIPLVNLDKCSAAPNPGVYSEIFFITEMGTGIGRLIVDPFHKLLYSSRAEDVNAIKQLTRKGLSVADAISQLLKERGFDCSPP